MNRKARILTALALASALPLACTNEHDTAARHPEPAVASPSGVPEGDHTGANPKNDVDNNQEHMAPTPPGTPPEDQRIPEAVAPNK